MLSLTGWCVCLSMCVCFAVLSISAVVDRLTQRPDLDHTCLVLFLTFILDWTTVDLQCCVNFSCVCVLVAQSCPTL